ncbi:MAG: hypothetical protein ACYDCM_00805 [Candidatus Acidiferrales bacterium]
MRTRYTRALEDEVARLRAENRALVNSILGVAGIPPMRMVAAARALRADPASHVRSLGVCVTDMRDLGRNTGKASRQPDTSRPAGRELQQPDTKHAAGSFESQDKRELQVAGEIAVPLRKRSWQQIERVREIEDARAARRERETDTETFPAPRNIVPRV